MFRDHSPKERYFKQMTTGNLCRSELGDINKKQDMIQQLQDRLLDMKTKVGRGGKLDNQKNASAMRCVKNTYNRPMPQMIKARHMKLTLGNKEDGTDYKGKAGAALNKNKNRSIANSCEDLGTKGKKLNDMVK